jgi:hypothetical protein
MRSRESGSFDEYRRGSHGHATLVPTYCTFNLHVIGIDEHFRGRLTAAVMSPAQVANAQPHSNDEDTGKDKDKESCAQPLDYISRIERSSFMRVPMVKRYTIAPAAINASAATEAHGCQIRP